MSMRDAGPWTAPRTQYVDWPLPSVQRRPWRVGAPHVLARTLRQPTTNTCRSCADGLQMQAVTVGRSSILDVSRTGIDHDKRHARRHLAGLSDSVRRASQFLCAIHFSHVGPLNPRPL
jgi:hypothetical protein